MLASENSKIRMYITVIKNLNKYIEVWENTAHFAAKVAAFTAIFEAIGDVVFDQEKDTTGYAFDKKRKKNELVESAMVVVLVTRSYASITGDRVLVAKMKYTIGKLKNLGAAELVLATSTIHEVATENIEGAGDYGLKQEFLDDLELKISEFSKAINDPADQLKLKKEATIKLKNLFIEGDAILKNNIDCDLIAFKKDHSEFYTQHFIQRRIYNSPVIKLAMRINIVDATTKEPIPNALVTIEDHKIKRKSSPKGALRIRNLSAGNHTVNVEMEGYQTQAVKATYTAGKTTMLTVEMVANG